MIKNLVIVESPAKAKTIEGFLGKDFTVKSSYGHIRDLIKSDKAIDVKNGFAPVYEIPEGKAKVVTDLKKSSKEAQTVWLATDEDREGEAIAWHLFEALKLTEKKTKRIVFHEITKSAIENAVKNPRKIDYHLVDAQQARRVLDRLVGFELSPILWKKVKPSLSAGRVQSVAVRLLVEREREIGAFKVSSAFKVVAQFEVRNEKGVSAFKAELPKKFHSKEDASAFLNNAIGAQFTVKNLETKPAKKSPSAPFTTSTLQQEASRKLGFSVAQTMLIAQRLYESGRITYMRTDSVNLSQTALDAAKKEITKSYGEKYVENRQYKTKSASAQEAHEAIRPTYFNQQEIEGDYNDKRLYDLIWKRTIASQMSDAQLEKTTATIGSSSQSKEEFIATGEVLKFDGFLAVYMESSDDENDETQEGMLPALTIGQKVELKEMSATERFTYPPSRYTEASLVKKMEELGIGRPSTYAPTISTIQKRGYVAKEERQGRERSYTVITLSGNKISEGIKTEITGTEKNKLFPTDIGAVVTDFLVENFANILDYNFTAKVEEEFDQIAEGKEEWGKMLKRFYGPFHKNVIQTEKTSERASGERELGKDPATGKKVIVRIGRFGPIVQIGSQDDEVKPRFASLRHGQRLETITFEEAMDLFKLPRKVGEFEGGEIIASVGRFGPYVKHLNAFYSLKREDDPLYVTLDRAIQIIQDKRKAQSERLIKTFEENNEVKIQKGRWGPYISIGKKNIRIPKDKEPASLTLEECLALEKIHDTRDTKKVKKAGPKK